MTNHSQTETLSLLASSTIKTILSSQNNKWLKIKPLLPVLVAITATIISITAVEAASVEIAYDDWQVVCDNTLTCRIAGYQADLNSDFPASILLTRQAGSNASVTGKIKLGGNKKGSSKALMELGDRHRASLFINGKDLGETRASSTGAGYADLNSAQVTALIEALTKSSKIEFVVRNARWQVSDKGATAVMLKADEAQGRVGTSSAFISTTNASATNSVLAPKAAPQLHLVVPNQKVNLSSSQKFSMKPSQLAEIMRSTIKNKASDCPNLFDKTSWKVSRLNSTQLLAQHTCWIGAYNTGDGMWVMNDRRPYNPKLVTTTATSYHDEGTIKSVQKGRSMGDCATTTEWIWTGKSFTKSYEGSTGLCRMVATGGAWELPSHVSEVKR